MRERRVSHLTPRHRDISPGGSCGTPGAGSSGEGADRQATCPERFALRDELGVECVIRCREGPAGSAHEVKGLDRGGPRHQEITMPKDGKTEPTLARPPVVSQ